ncbi:MAG: GNAT family N-acetyltransferase [Candidatus Zixiibacteriota bacterium]|nr:MAG: GNAT family N-acetyltransferase [candidate division Zixibacteria bacterium]
MAVFSLARPIESSHTDVVDEIELRQATTADSDFAYRVKKLAFGSYVEQVWGWDEDEQRRLHEKRFASQQFRVIEWSDTDVGIIAAVREDDGLKINQLFVLPEYQGKGIGRACMKRIIDEAVASKSPIRLRVLKINFRAMAFFERLGFNRIGETDTHILMESLP